MTGDNDLRLREAIEDLDRYLGDQVAPLLVTDSVEILLDYSPELTAEALYSWTTTQQRLRGDETLTNLLFHAVKKIQLFEEFNLLPRERFTAFLAGVAEHLLAVTPEGERERLEGMLAFLRAERGTASPVLGRLHRAPIATATAPVRAAEPSTPLTPEELRSLRRFSLLFERLNQRGGGDGEPAADDVSRQLLILAASGATSSGDLESRMARLHQAGVGPAFARDLVRSLSASIPDWVVRRGASVEVVRGESVEAVRRAVRLAGDGARTLERWKDLLRAAAENFNQGAYARAVTLLDLAERMVADKELDRQVADIARGTAHEAFEPTRMLQAAADPENRPLLRRLVEFFPVWSVRELLDTLVFQPDPKQRRLVLALLEVWGEAAYQPVIERLGTAIAEGSRDPNLWWYLRNLVYLLHRLPRPAATDAKQLLELVAPFSALDQHPSFQRETITLLGQLPSGIGAPLLVQRLAECERSLVGTAPPPHELREMEKILSSLAVALVRSGSSSARRALVEHGLAQRPRTGDAGARLRELGAVDLSGDRDALAKLLDAARSLQPKKVLGFTVSRNEDALIDVVRALASTTDSSARRILAELAERFPDREYGRLAALGAAGATAALPEPVSDPEESESFLPIPAPAVQARSRASLAGDLEVFGLPGLLQSLEQSDASGRLVLRNAAGGERAHFELVEGRLGSCRCGPLAGESAFYQVFEQPLPGTFEFVRETGVAVGSRPRGTDIMGLLMEAMRRFDEFQRLRALVPDQARLRPGEARPSALAGEQDGELMRRLWTRLREGASVLELDGAAEVDPYRSRSLLAHWLEEGAVRLEAAPPATAGAVGGGRAG
ncbi:MAG TPA: DUF4388 domain-containing protein [Thermoanaerobaculia bacterium]|nr:DUF4388 domain-containing protein [Thermoanaerobaculia bacterium]